MKNPGMSNIGAHHKVFRQLEKGKLPSAVEAWAQVSDGARKKKGGRSCPGEKITEYYGPVKAQ